MEQTETNKIEATQKQYAKTLRFLEIDFHGSMKEIKAKTLWKICHLPLQKTELILKKYLIGNSYQKNRLSLNNLVYQIESCI